MKLPLTWLREYVHCDDSPARLAERLTFAGIEVEAIETFGDRLEGVVAAEILSIQPHPGADRLKVCRVSDGRGERTVVCGADNFKIGDKVALAADGVTLANGLRIRTARLRGVLSEGMLCAADELGLSDDHSGILLLPSETLPGDALGDIMGPPETVLTLEVTPNRGDCLSLIGMAREVAALYRLPLQRPEPLPAMDPVAVTDRIAVTVADADGCPRYTAHVISGCRVASSPPWMQRRLSLCGVRPINNVVDITNYVMLECGQPLHAFDRARLPDARLVVRRAHAGETLAMLDATQRRLDPSMLVIADSADAVAVAGVMGGEASGITDATSDVVLESAFFTPSDVRRTARRLGVSTEASYRFERGVDPEQSVWAGRRAAALLTELAGGRCARGVIDVAAIRPPAPAVHLRSDRVRSVLGCDVADSEIVTILEALDFQVHPASSRDREYHVKVPSYRMDVNLEADLIEEVARLYGLERIPVSDPCARRVADADDQPVREAMRCRDRLVGLGLLEIMNYSFVSHKFLDIFMPDAAAERLVIPYPVSADHAVLRPSLIPQMIETLGRNHARQISQAALFECGRVFGRAHDGSFTETERLAIGLMGPVGRGAMDRQRPVAAQEIFLWLKGIAEQLVVLQRLPQPATRAGAALAPALETAPLAHAFFEPGQGMSISVGGVALGIIGIVARPISAQWRFTTPLAVMELTLEPLLAAAGSTPRLRPAPTFPSVRRDLAMTVAQDLTNHQVMRVIAENAPPQLTAVHLFDIFQGKGIGPGLKSLAYAFTYRADDRTLTDEDVNRMHARVREAVQRQLGAALRE